ncbi:MAG: hypothetical protein U0359_36265 [Byssovorax sp.]
MSDETKPLPAFPGGPDPSAPIPTTPVEGLDLAAFARASARLADRSRPRAATLAELGLDEVRWATIEQTWMLRIAAALLKQDLALPTAYENALAEARRGLSSGQT